jgi:hypothetical protein
MISDIHESSRMWPASMDRKIYLQRHVRHVIPATFRADRARFISSVEVELNSLSLRLYEEGAYEQQIFLEDCQLR